MNAFKRNSLYAALAGAGALGVTGAAQAVNINPDGLGQALIYPYYTVNGFGVGGTTAPYNSLLSVVNSTASGKVVKVRFLEGRNSREVLDFNLWLSPFDVWTTAIIPLPNVSGQPSAGAGIYTTDLSCTTPAISTTPSAPTAFLNFGYTGTSADGGDTTLARTKEGYVEIIEMGNVTGGTLTAITHAQPSPPGVPPGCKTLPTGITPPTDLVAGQGGLFGGISLVNVLAGGDITEDAVALASFSATSLWAPAGYTSPDLTNVNPKTSVVFNNTEVVNTSWAGLTFNAADPVSAVFMRNNVFNEFVLDAATKSGTDWVVTMPTKRYYYDSSLNVLKLFQSNFRATGACDDVIIAQINREEATVISQSSFSPPQPGNIDSLCYEANTLTFNNTNVLASQIVKNISTTFTNGWVALNFFPPSISGATHTLVGGATTRFNTGTLATTSQANATYNGLPVVGFAAQYFNNGTLTGPGGTGVQAFYTGAFAHKYTRLIQ